MGMERHIHEGVYAMLGGPNFETVAELKMLRICGVDAVGKSAMYRAGSCKISAFLMRVRKKHILCIMR